MKKNPQLLYDDEIDLTALFKIIWDDKIKILLITIILFLIGLGYSYQLPENYLTSLTINKRNNYEFSEIKYLNTLIKPNKSNKSNKLNKSNQLNQTLLDRFMNELKDYEEFIFILKDTKKVRENISILKIEDQEKELFKYAKFLEIVEPKKNKGSYILNFVWNDLDEVKKIFQDTLNLTLQNFEIKIYDELKQSLEFEKKFILNSDLARLDYLREQSSIAKELNITDNQIDNANLSQSNVSLNINTADIAYYLRGYKAIDKEIELIINREYKHFKYIEEEINSLRKKSINWISYNIYLAEVKSLKNTKLILIISILSSLIIGVFYVLISNAFQSKSKNFPKKRTN